MANTDARLTLVLGGARSGKSRHAEAIAAAAAGKVTYIATARVEGGSDNGAFAVAGLPGIGTQQDNIEYNSTTWHTNLDTYERIVPVRGNAAR